jgi:metallo-beta-lactamase family protein
MFAVELGGIQEGHTALANYNLNKAQLNKIKPKLLQYIFVEHFHYDHVGLIPAAYAKGCMAQIIIPKGGTAILKEMWLDSAKIMQRDCETLSRKSGKNYQPFYDESDVFNTLSYITEYKSNEIIILTDELSFRYLPAGHIMLSQQLELYIKLGMNTRKILFTSDLGNTITEKNRVFVEPFQPCDKAQIVIGESTYGLRDKRNGNKDLKNDLAKIKTVIEQFCVDNNRRVLFPTFSLDRTPIMLWYLYQIFGKDKSFKVPIIVDSPLAIRLLKHYRDILADYQDGRIELFDEMMSWENIQLITEYTDSEAAIKDNSGKVILAAGGMLQSGRSVVWAQHIIPCSNDCIAFCGYAGVDTLGYKIKHAKNQKTITINNKTVANRCQVIELLSFSSHQQHNELVDYYSNITADKIYLLHGDEQARIELKEDIQNELTKKCKSTKVSIVNKSTVIKL